MSDVAIRVEGLGKQYRIGGARRRTNNLREKIQHAMLAPFRAMGGADNDEAERAFWALRDVNFQVNRGEVVGVIGRNGAGKSTLLKILSRITEPTEGEVEISGRVGSLLEVGTGFHPELTGRENVFLNGAILGMKQAEIVRRFDEIVSFAEVEKFLDTPVKHYSSGMYMRLAFAVAAHLEPEILIVDEVLAVGDAQFQAKCIGKMQDVSRQGRTVVFVSHNMGAVQNLCERCIWLAGGNIQHVGQTADVIAGYFQSASRLDEQSMIDRKDRTGTGIVKCVGARIVDSSNQPIPSVRPNEDFTIEIEFQAAEPVTKLMASVDIETTDGVRVATLWSGFRNQSFSADAGRGVLRCCVHGLNLRPDTYSLNLGLGDEVQTHDLVPRAGRLQIDDADVYGSGRSPSRSQGVALINFDWQIRAAHGRPLTVGSERSA